jgi:zinc transport system substrate-binding protein
MFAPFRQALRLLPWLALLLAPVLAPRLAVAVEGLETKASVAVGVAPLRFLVARVAGPGVELQLLVPPGASAENYDPKPRELRRFSAARLFFALDTPVERLWLPRLQHLNPGLEVVALEAPDRPLDWNGTPLAVDAQSVSRSERDFHLWTSPAVLAAWVAPVEAALARTFPAQAENFARNAGALRAELTALDAQLAQALQEHAGRAFLTLHPAWGYFAHRYGLQQLAIEVEGREAGPRELHAVLERAREAGVRRVFVPAPAAVGQVEAIADALAAEVTVVDELAEDYPGNLRRFARALEDAFAVP